MAKTRSAESTTVLEGASASDVVEFCRVKELLNALEQDHEFLLEGNVFTKDLIETWLAYKREKEVDPVRLRPHPYEFFLYYDV